MRANQNVPVLIVSCNRPTIEADMNMIKLFLPGVKPIVCEGVYKGKKENSYIFAAGMEQGVMRLARRCNQESVLYLDHSRQASFIGVNDSIESGQVVGYFEACTKQEAIANGDYTYRPDTCQYYIIK